MSVSKWHLIIILVLMLLSAAFLVLARMALLWSSKKKSKTKWNSYIFRARANQDLSQENAGKFGSDIKQLADQMNTISRDLGRVLNTLDSGVESPQIAHPALTKLEQDIVAIRQNHAEKIAPLLRDLNANIQNLNKAVAKAPSHQSQELKQILLALGDSPKSSGPQEDTKALMEEINQKLYALNAQEILARLDEMTQQASVNIRNSLYELMYRSGEPLATALNDIGLLLSDLMQELKDAPAHQTIMDKLEDLEDRLKMPKESRRPVKDAQRKPGGDNWPPGCFTKTDPS
jgi:archaellum component FlaC